MTEEDREWFDIMVQAENLMKVKRLGFCYLEMKNFEVAQMLCDRIHVNLMTWLEDYFDYDDYND